MHLSGRPLAVVVATLYAVLVLTAALVPDAPAPATVADETLEALPPTTPGDGTAPQRIPAGTAPDEPARKGPGHSARSGRRGDGWSGFAFDACRAPSQRVMDRWLRTSPFLGVGIYIGGVHRACKQKHLSRTWVSRQMRSGWRLLPIWVGPQGPCTGYDHTIKARAVRSGHFTPARQQGKRQARAAVAAARRLGLPRQHLIWYDIEPFPTDRLRCRRPALAFLDAWTREVHRLGYKSGVYSHVKAGIPLLHEAPRSIARPDAIWYAWISDDAGVLPRKYVKDPSWMRTSRVHQFVLDRRVRFGGIPMDIDWNYVSLGGPTRPAPAGPCGAEVDSLRVMRLVPGLRHPTVGVAECLLARTGHQEAPADGVFGPDTRKAVTGLQRSKGLPTTGALDRRTWMALLSVGQRPVLKRGSAGEPVRRLQRVLNAALNRRIRVDGLFGPATTDAVKRYQRLVGHPRHGVVTEKTWKALARGKVTAPKPARKPAKARAGARAAKAPARPAPKRRR